MTTTHHTHARNKYLDWVLGIITILSFLGALGMVFLYAPREAIMGEIQRIFYFHVASAWVGFFGFFITFLGSVAYLTRREPKWDRLAVASAEIGLTFITMAVITGSMWAKPAWGTYWTWEPRLTISAIQWFLYVAYVMLRATAIEGGDQEARYAAVYGIAAFITVPLSWFAIRWWRTIHPQILYGGGMALTTKMLHTLLVSLFSFTLLYGTLLRQRIQLEEERETLAALRAKMDR